MGKLSHDKTTTSPYRKVSTSTWADLKVRNLSPIEASGQGLFLMLMVGPQTTNMPGVQPVGRLAFSEMLGWDVEAFDKAFGEVLQQGLAVADWKARFVFVPNAIKHNLPQSPNVVKSWAATWALVPECDLKVRAWHAIHAALSEMGPSFVAAFKGACPLSLPDDKPAQPKPVAPAAAPPAPPTGKPSAKTKGKATDNQEQEQEQEQESETHGADAARQFKQADEGKPIPKALGVRELVADGVSEQHAKDWLKVRTAQRAPLTQTAWDAVKREAVKAGLSPDDAVRICAEKSWRGFMAEWMKGTPAGKPPTPPFDPNGYGPGGRL